jgi:hypothetical protein
MDRRVLSAALMGKLSVAFSVPLACALLGACGSAAKVGEVSTMGATGGGSSSSSSGGATTQAQWVWQSDVPSTGQLNAVWASGPADVWAAGDDGLLLHYDGSAWSLASSGTISHIRALWGSSPDDVWAVAGGVGGAGAANLVHWNGAAWSVADPGTALNLSGVWGSRANDVYAVGGDSVTGTIQHFDGSAWSTIWSSATTGPAAVWGSSASDVWVVGSFIYPASGDHYILHGTGGGDFTDVPSGVTHYLSSVWSAAPDDTWAFGFGGLVHGDGQAFTAVPTTLPLGSGGVWGLDAEHVWLVGADPRIAAWNGNTWTIQHEDSAGAALVAVGGTDTSHVWAVGANATIFQIDTAIRGTPTCGDVGGTCGDASACAPGSGHVTDYACTAGATCCVVETACGGPELSCCDGSYAGARPTCHDGAFVCPSPSTPCPLHP